MIELKSNLKDITVQAGLVVGATYLPKGKWSFAWESSRYWDEFSDTPLTMHTLSTRYRLNRSHALEIDFNRRDEDVRQVQYTLAYQFRW